MTVDDAKLKEEILNLKKRRNAIDLLPIIVPHLKLEFTSN